MASKHFLIICWSKAAPRFLPKIDEFYWHEKFERHIWGNRLYDPELEKDRDDFAKAQQLIKEKFYEDPQLPEMDVLIVPKPYPNLEKAREVLANQSDAPKPDPPAKAAKKKATTKKKSAKKKAPRKVKAKRPSTAKKKKAGGERKTTERPPAESASAEE